PTIRPSRPANGSYRQVASRRPEHQTAIGPASVLGGRARRSSESGVQRWGGSSVVLTGCGEM
ncbi:hypothetical protein, partial [Ilumatobacter sp.]|uniref:hypothetical protein n=1 Tax=Ilumatobacter sp. TaxID=1967498 RepID=UPI003C6F02FD